VTPPTRPSPSLRSPVSCGYTWPSITLVFRNLSLPLEGYLRTPKPCGTDPRTTYPSHAGACVAILMLLLLVLPAAGCNAETGPGTEASGSSAQPETTTLLMYAGAASKPPTEEAIELFREKTGITVEVTFGGSGSVLSQMKLTEQGDLYFPGSSDYMERAKRDGDVIAETEARIAYLVPAINVQKGNPKSILALKDLIRSDVKVAIADPESVCLGLYAVEILEQEFSSEERTAFRKNLLNYTGSCEKTATAISLKQVDAVIGWSVFEYWDPEGIETVPLEESQIPRVGYLPIAVSKYTGSRAAAQQFIDFLLSSEGQAVFAKYHYFATPEDAFAWLGSEKPVGGNYSLPPEWIVD